jgi:hypothetical protein
MFSPKTNTAPVPDEQAMREVMLLLDEWQAPEPSPWFDARMMARFREEQERNQGFVERLSSLWLFRNMPAARPIMIGVLVLLLMVGGGSYLEFGLPHAAKPANVSATVEDLQILDNNAQAIQQMDQLLDENDDSPQS